ncbi:unnamed protein product, partial [Amoebophrya sp. A25]
CLPLLVNAHRDGQSGIDFVFDDEGSFPTLPFLHVFNAFVLVFGLEGAVSPTESALEALHFLSSSPTNFLRVGVSQELAASPTATVGEFLLECVSASFDYVLKEVCLFSPHSNVNRLVCQAMWRTLCICLDTAAINGEIFLELCNNDCRFPVAIARMVVRLEPCIARPLSELWIAKYNLRAADAVALKAKTRAADETGALHDLFEFKRRLAMAFVDEEMLDKMLRCAETLFEEAFVGESDDELVGGGANSLGFMNLEELGSGAAASKAMLTARRTEEFRVLLSCLCRCISEMGGILTDPRYVVWATSKHRKFFERLKRHLILQGGSIADFAHEKLYCSEKISAWDSVFTETLDALLALKLLHPETVMTGSLIQEPGGQGAGDEAADLLLGGLGLGYAASGPAFSVSGRTWPRA